MEVSGLGDEVDVYSMEKDSKSGNGEIGLKWRRWILSSSLHDLPPWLSLK